MSSTPADRSLLFIANDGDEKLCNMHAALKCNFIKEAVDTGVLFDHLIFPQMDGNSLESFVCLLEHAYYDESQVMDACAAIIGSEILKLDNFLSTSQFLQQKNLSTILSKYGYYLLDRTKMPWDGKDNDYNNMVQQVESDKPDLEKFTVHTNAYSSRNLQPGELRTIEKVKLEEQANPHDKWEIFKESTRNGTRSKHTEAVSNWEMRKKQKDKEEKNEEETIYLMRFLTWFKSELGIITKKMVVKFGRTKNPLIRIAKNMVQGGEKIFGVCPFIIDMEFYTRRLTDASYGERLLYTLCANNTTEGSVWGSDTYAFEPQEGLIFFQNLANGMSAAPPTMQAIPLQITESVLARPAGEVRGKKIMCGNIACSKVLPSNTPETTLYCPNPPGSVLKHSACKMQQGNHTSRNQQVSSMQKAARDEMINNLLSQNFLVVTRVKLHREAICGKGGGKEEEKNRQDESGRKHEEEEAEAYGITQKQRRPREKEIDDQSAEALPGSGPLVVFGTRVQGHSPSGVKRLRYEGEDNTPEDKEDEKGCSEGALEKKKGPHPISSSSGGGGGGRSGSGASAFETSLSSSGSKLGAKKFVQLTLKF